MSEWGRATFGDPCHGCRFGWSTELPEASEVIEDAGTNPFTMVHEELGNLTLADVILIRAYDVVHHSWDIERTLAVSD